MNFGPQAKTPTWTLEYEPQEDLNSKAKRWAIIHKDIGLPVSKEQIYDDLQVQTPQDEEDTLAAGIEADKAATGIEDPLTLALSEPPASAGGQDVKKKSLLTSGRPSNSKTERFMRFRPSMIEFSDE
jgi:hypothetical protein